jgi:uncharacterized protein
MIAGSGRWMFVAGLGRKLRQELVGKFETERRRDQQALEVDVRPESGGDSSDDSQTQKLRGRLAQTVGGPVPCENRRQRPMPAPTAADVRVLDVPERSRFEVRVDGELAGFAEYRRRAPLIAFTHTLIDPRFEGQGLAGQLVATALSEARSAGLAVLPFCPFVRGYIAGHTAEYLDLVPGDLRDPFELPADA